MLSISRRSIAELLGTFALVVVGPGAVMVAARTHAFSHIGISLAFGLVVLVIVAAIGHISGAHVNPAVTIGLWSVGRFRSADVIPYVLAQCTGAVAASSLLAWLLGDVGMFGATLPSVPIAQAFVIEMGYTGVLGFVVMAFASDERVAAHTAPFVIGATICVGALVTGPLTGGSFNPARSLGPALVSGNVGSLWLYCAAPVLGAVLSMRLYQWLRGARPAAGEVDGTEGPL